VGSEIAEIAIIQVFVRLEKLKEEKLTDTGLYDFSRIWKILLDGKFGHWMARAKALSINFLNQIYI
jgi:hypothetical protein